jgi:RNase P subunit RPR2
MPCKYCNEQDESKLMMSSRCVNGKVETIDICLRCYWRERFEAEAKGNGKSILQERESFGRTNSEREIFKRFKFSSSPVG